MRPLIRYDLDEPPLASAPAGSPQTNARRPPAKKRKRTHHNSQNFPPASSQKKAPIQHWDDPGSAAVGVVYDEQEDGATTAVPLATGSVAMLYAEDVEEVEEEEHYAEEGAEGDDVVDMEQGENEEEEEESRQLTNEEIWDDSALIDAWNSAEAEYEAYHGTSKAWKTESIKKSPLWYNKPYTPPAPQPGPSKSKPRSKPVLSEQADAEPDTAPLNFDTYVPMHDPSLGIPPDVTTTTAGVANSAANAPFFVPSPSTTTISRDEAFNNALSAMYWGGYWTAVYHCQSQVSREDTNVRAEATEEDGLRADEDEGEEDLVPAQR